MSNANVTITTSSATSTEDLLSVYAVYDASHVPAEGTDDPVSGKEEKHSTGSVHAPASNVHCTLIADFLLLYLCHCLVFMFFLH